MILARKINGALAAVFLSVGPGEAADGPNGLQKLMLYRSCVQVASDCAVVVVGGVTAINVENAASGATTWPDAFA